MALLLHKNSKFVDGARYRKKVLNMGRGKRGRGARLRILRGQGVGRG